MRLSNPTVSALHSFRWRVLVSAWVYLCLSLIGGTAQASMLVRSEAIPIAVFAMPSSVMPQAMDCAPCVRCYVAPVPAVQGFNGECKEAHAPHWQLHITAPVDAAWIFNTGVWRPRLPVRIEYSRWLN